MWFSKILLVTSPSMLGEEEDAMKEVNEEEVT